MMRAWVPPQEFCRRLGLFQVQAFLNRIRRLVCLFLGQRVDGLSMTAWCSSLLFTNFGELTLAQRSSSVMFWWQPMQRPVRSIFSRISWGRGPVNGQCEPTVTSCLPSAGHDLAEVVVERRHRLRLELRLLRE